MRLLIKPHTAANVHTTRRPGPGPKGADRLSKQQNYEDAGKEWGKGPARQRPNHPFTYFIIPV
jgi:hypothetical protein